MSKRKIPPAATFPDEPIVVSLIRQLSWPHYILLLLRAQPRPVTRLNRRTLVALAGGVSVAVLGATLWS